MFDRKDAAAGKREKLRRHFRPACVSLLLIGESPPASGRFFYQADSRLYRAVRNAFRSVDPLITDDRFLAVFQASGCYLIDLCSDPVDHLDPRARNATCRASEASLAQSIAQLQLQALATIVRSIEDNVARAASLAQWHGPVMHLPYSGRWSRHRAVFINALLPAIKSLLGQLPQHPCDAAFERREADPI